jgi:hypothetical protein
MKRVLSLVLAALIALPGCASVARHQRRDMQPGVKTSGVDAMVMSDYIRQLPIGSRVRVTRSDRKTMRATLIKHDTDPIVVQRRTRLPEPPIEIPVSDILAVELDTPNGGSARNIAVGAAAAAGVVLGVLLLIAAVVSD